ncbi:hypothetical protein AAAC51_06510 [Priestia megaterium]
MVFLAELCDKDPEYFNSLKKSHRWYLSGKQDDKQKRLFDFSPRIAHLLMIAKTDEGYKNLIKLTTIGSLEGFYGSHVLITTILNNTEKELLLQAAAWVVRFLN